MQIGALLRLAETVLALDLDVIEAMRQREALDLGALGVGGAVGDQRQPDAERLQGSIASCAPGKTNISSSR